jgi:rubrerythrin
MLRQVLLDKLSEFLIVEQGGLELYRIAAERCSEPTRKARYEDFGRETSHHREMLVRLIERLEGDPNYVSPTARVAQFKAAKLLESSLVVDGLSPAELEANDLENVLLAETKDYANWHLLEQLVRAGEQGGVVEAAQQAIGAVATAATGGPPDQVDASTVAQALRDAVAEVETEEDKHLSWARDQLSEACLRMVVQGPAPSPARWHAHISSPAPSIEAFHPAPVTEGLLEFASEPQWQASRVVRSLRST